jgi:hypothetical protein
MRSQAILRVFLVLGTGVVVGLVWGIGLTSGPSRLPAAAEVALQASPFPMCSAPYTITLVSPSGMATSAMLHVVDRRVWALPPSAVSAYLAGVRQGADGNILVDLDLPNEDTSTVRSILTTPAILIIIANPPERGLAVGTKAPSEWLKTPIVTNSGDSDLDAVYQALASLPGHTDQTPVVSLVLTEPGADRLATYVASAPPNARTVAIVVDGQVIDSHPLTLPAPTAVDVFGLGEAPSEALTAELQGGPLPAPLQATFTPRRCPS